VRSRSISARESNLKNISHCLAIFFLLLVFVFGSACRDTTAPASAEITVAAASDLTPAFEEIGREFQASHGIKVVHVFGSTGLLTRQIENGAPFDVFAAANVSFIDQLDQKGFVLPGTKWIYGRGRITLWTTANSPLKIEKIEDLARADVARIAIANPDHAPYGQAAREALECARVWDAVRPKLVYGDNIRQTLQYAETGNVEVAIMSLSLSIESKGRWVLVPEELHKPIDQGMGVIKGTKNEQAARAFSDFVNGPQGKAILQKYGFTFQ
jgi:molybdate transport system substrate-binding protein